jgi:carbamoyltransferase
MWILGLANSHNGAVALIKDGRVEVAIQLERLAKRKRYPLHLSNDPSGEPSPAAVAALNYCLAYCNISLKEIDIVAASTPWPMKSACTWPLPNIQWVPHHLAHAEYALHYSLLKPGLVFVADGHGSHQADKNRFCIQENISGSAALFSGDAETISAYTFDGRELVLIYRMCGSSRSNFELLEGSIGKVWELGSLICFGARDQAGKVMGLAAYGKNSFQEGFLGLDTSGRLITNLSALKRSSSTT